VAQKSGNAEEIAQANTELKKAETSLLDYKKQQEIFLKEGQEGWDELSAGIRKMGESISFVGTGISLLGTLF
jgi:hypothetical protein